MSSTLRNTVFMLMIILMMMVSQAFILPIRPIRRCCPLRMALVDQINDEMKAAMKAKATDKLSALRNIRAAFLTAMKEDGAETLADDKAITILRKLQKQRQESIEMFLRAPGREDMVEAEKSELALIETYLPQLADEATTTKWVEAAIEEAGATAPKDMGKVMGAVTKKHKGGVDMKLVQKIATDLLKAKSA